MQVFVNELFSLPNSVADREGEKTAMPAWILSYGFWTCLEIYARPDVRHFENTGHFFHSLYYLQM